MGMCLPCLGGPGNDLSPTPDRETRKRQLAEAAEKRQKETTYRGVKNPQAVKRNKKNKEMEKQEMRPCPSGGGGGGGGGGLEVAGRIKIDTWRGILEVSNVD